MTWLIAILRMLLELLLPVLVQEAGASMEDGVTDTEAADRLKAKIKEVWG